MMHAICEALHEALDQSFLRKGESGEWYDSLFGVHAET